MLMNGFSKYEMNLCVIAHFLLLESLIELQKSAALNHFRSLQIYIFTSFTNKIP